MDSIKEKTENKIKDLNNALRVLEEENEKLRKKVKSLETFITERESKIIPETKNVNENIASIFPKCMETKS